MGTSDKNEKNSGKRKESSKKNKENGRESENNAVQQQCKDKNNVVGEVDMDNDRIDGFPPAEMREALKKQNKGHQHNELDDRQEFNLFGANIPLLNVNFSKDIEAAKLETFCSKGDVIKSEDDKYRIEKKLHIGQNMYKVRQHSSKSDFVMKLEPIRPLRGCAKLSREVILMKNSRKTEKKFRKHFLKMVDRGKVDTQYHFIVCEMGGRSLVDIKAKLKPSDEFWPSDSVRLCMQTLQAIHDIHLCRFIHRDIQPRNFVVGMEQPNVVFVVNFGLSFEYYPNEKNTLSILPKLKSMNKKFQPRAFHTGSEYNRLGDMEAWLYLCYWFFDSKCLPWEDLLSADCDDVSERQMCCRKERFLIGIHDREMAQKSSRYLPTSLCAMRNKIYSDSLSSSPAPINYSFFGEAILKMCDEILVEWNKPYQWQLAGKEIPVERFIKHNHLPTDFCIACENSPMAKSTCKPTAKSQELKTKTNAYAKMLQVKEALARQKTAAAKKKTAEGKAKNDEDSNSSGKKQ